MRLLPRATLHSDSEQAHTVEPIFPVLFKLVNGFI
jgi:hypothetical protein